MLTAIKFDNELLLSADKIGDVWTNGKLAAEFESKECAIAEMRPETPLSIGLIDAKRSGSRNVLTFH